MEIILFAFVSLFLYTTLRLGNLQTRNERNLKLIEELKEDARRGYRIRRGDLDPILERGNEALSRFSRDRARELAKGNKEFLNQLKAWRPKKYG